MAYQGDILAWSVFCPFNESPGTFQRHLSPHPRRWLVRRWRSLLPDCVSGLEPPRTSLVRQRVPSCEVIVTPFHFTTLPLYYFPPYGPPLSEEARQEKKMEWWSDGEKISFGIPTTPTLHYSTFSMSSFPFPFFLCSENPTVRVDKKEVKRRQSCLIPYFTPP